MKSYFTAFLVALSLIILKTETASASSSPKEITLGRGWLIQSSRQANETGDVLSMTSYSPAGWYAASVPSTVVGTLVANGVYKNPFQGRNLNDIPDSLFNVPWWYRVAFDLPAKGAGHDHVTLKFLGINYRADIWLNGKLVASNDSVCGGFRQFQFDVSGMVLFGKENVLAVRIFKPVPGSMTLGFVDWSPNPPDHDMGLWRPVRLQITGGVSIEDPFVASSVDTVTLKRAELTISTELVNMSDADVSGTLVGKIGSVVFSRKETILAHQRKDVAFTPAEFRQLVFKNPRLWWTQDFGKPNLYPLHLEFRTGSYLSDETDLKFGIRQISDYINADGFRGYILNGKKILLRGGGWADHIFLDADKHNVDAQIEYAVNMHLNMIRMEGFWGENSDIYDDCDEKGIMIMAGFSCQWEWENIFGKPNDNFGCIKSPEDMALAARSLEDEVNWLRNHPSIFVWAYGSDLIPRPELERKYLAVLHACDTTRPFLASAAEHTSEVTGPTAVKMRGPYDYVPPIYWFADTAHGGAFGFNTETGPGPEVPRTESLKKMLSPDSLWPINGEWYFHTSRGIFRDLKRYNDAIDSRLGKPTSLEDYERKAQFTNYEGMRAMFEAFGGAKFKSTGLVQWMYNSAWPKMWWQFYDYYLDPTAAFYGAQKACEPVHVEYNPSTHDIVVVNSTLEAQSRLKVLARVLGFDLKEEYRTEKTASVGANSSMAVAHLPQIDSPSKTYFLDLQLFEGKDLVSSNFYALSTTEDSLQWKESTWYVTESSHADLTELNNLEKVSLDVKHNFTTKAGESFVHAVLHNPTNKLAFMVYVSVRKGSSGDSVLPTFWNRNYVTLLPGETKVIDGSFHLRDLGGEQPRLDVSGWNVDHVLEP